jgi:uncharacterized protein YqfA (UPF0365 family)
MNYKIPLKEMLFMNLRGVPILKIKKELKKAERHQLEVEHMDLQAHYLAEGDITDLIDSMVFAKENGMDLSFQTAAVGQLMAKYQEKVALLDKLKIMKEEGVDDVEDFLRSGSIQSELDNA